MRVSCSVPTPVWSTIAGGLVGYDSCGRTAPPTPHRGNASKSRHTVIAFGKKGKKAPGGGGNVGVATKKRESASSAVTYVTFVGDGSDDWRLDDIATLIRNGAVGIVPTDTKYALVCDLESRQGVQLLYDLKGKAFPVYHVRLPEYRP
jgi:hypothetical protein